ncbi:hypothetical protein L7F22_057563 [Adiantum nelumboides]|nr:hypothetical protein [Adiantum nelumboides]
MTRTKSLVAKLPQQPGEFMVKKWVEKALPKTSQQKLRENLRPDATLEEFVAAATRIEGARKQFTESSQVQTGSVLLESPSDPLISLRRELEALKLQRALQEERSISLRQEKPSHNEALDQIKRELEELRSQQETKSMKSEANHAGDIKELHSYYQSLLNHADNLEKHSNRDSDRVQLRKMYHSASILFEVLEALSLRESCEIPAEILESGGELAAKQEVYAAYNILPLDAASSSQGAMMLPEVNVNWH